MARTRQPTPNHALAVLALASLVPVATAQSFTDVTAAAGFSGSFLPSPLDTAEVIMSSGIAVGDVDGDGWEDIFWAAGSLQPCRLYHNVRGTGFVDVAAAAGVDVKVAGNSPVFCDVDGDGDLDLYMTVVENDLQVQAAGKDGQGSGPSSSVAKPVAPGIGLVAHRNLLFRNEGDGTFTEVSAEAGLLDGGRWGAAFGDLDGDGWLDLVNLSWANQRPWFFRNRGNGRFRDVTPANVRADLVWGFTPRLVDYDDDGDVDVLCANDLDTSRLWRNDGNWNFTNVTVAAGVGTDENGMGSTIADFDHDGDLDWFVTSIYSPYPIPLAEFGASGNRLYVNNGDGTFSDGTDAAGVRDGGWGWAAQFADLDNDGDLDIPHSNGWYSYAGGVPQLLQFDTDRLRVFMNDGTGVFTESSAALGIDDADQGRGLVVFDADHDGALDILVANNDVGLRLYKGDPADLGHWLAVELRAPSPNTRAVGAKVTLSAAGLADQLMVMECGNNFISQAPMELWYGLGAATSASVSVTWPDGSVSAHAFAADQRVLITKPD